MKIHILILSALLILHCTTTSAVNVNGRLISNGTNAGKLEVLLQINTNTGTAALGGATIVIGFNHNTLNFATSPQVNTHYLFHNFNGGNYNTATVTRPATGRIWLNIDLPFNNSNNGYIVSGTNGWTDIATLYFDIINPNDTLKINWLFSNPYSTIYNACNIAVWNPGTFQDLRLLLNADVTPPEVVNASPLDSENLEITFSEALEISSAVNITNYSIGNGINILGAYLSSNQNKVTLNTTPHNPGQSYMVTVSNVRDVAGNMISGMNNSAGYTFMPDITPPQITGVTITSNQSVTVKFSERLDPVSAKNKNNYSISDNINIISVQLMPDSTEVKLKTSKHTADRDYILTVSNIKDRAGNIQAPNPKSTVYRMPGKIKGSSSANSFENAAASYWEQAYTPHKAIDGLGQNTPDSRWQSTRIMPDTITFSMEEIVSTDSIRIAFYKGETGRLYKYSVCSSLDLNSWNTIVENIWSEAAEWTSIEFDSTSCRYLRLILHESNQGNKAGIWEFESYGISSSVSSNQDLITPLHSELLQNYPNPFNPSTKIRWQSPLSCHQTLKIYDVLGNEIAVLVDEFKTAGRYEVNFDAGDLASGVYVYRLTADNFTETKKMILLR